MDAPHSLNVEQDHKVMLGILVVIFIICLGCFVILALSKEKFSDASGYDRAGSLPDEDGTTKFNKKYPTTGQFPDKNQNILKLHLHSNPDLYELIDLNSNLLDDLRVIFERKLESLNPDGEYHISDINVKPHVTGPIVVDEKKYSPETYAVFHFEHPAKKTQAKLPLSESGGGADERIFYRVNNLPPRDVKLLRKVL